MEESVLLDLLECPVCLERLDASAKVLPCQHTFCRRCLLGIVGSRPELRCPECRTLVGTPVDALPSNILLVRLLDGIKQRPRRPGPAPPAGPSAAAGPRPPGPREPGAPAAAQPQRAQPKSSLLRVGVAQLPCAKALYNYDGKESGDLRFSKGDVIVLRRQVDENWFHGETAGASGFFPTNFVQVLTPLPLPPPQCKALYDFELKDKEADKDCLPFSKDDVLTVIRRVDENWAEGMLGDKIGIFPISYVEFNAAGRHLVELDKPSEPGGDWAEGASPGAQGPGVPRGAGEKKNTKKRHSFTSLTMSHKPSLAPPPQRHSMEISGPVLISSSNPTAAARIGELSGGLSCSAPSQVHICTSGLIVTPPPISPLTTATVFAFPPETGYTSISVDALPPPPPPPPQSSVSGAVSSLAAAQRPAPGPGEPTGRQRPTVYVAMFPYPPRKEDELELRKGEMFLVLERCQDGWFKGTSMHTGKIGVFPGNYMSPINRTLSGVGPPKLPLTLAPPQGGRSLGAPTPLSPPPSSSPAPGPDANKPLPACTGPAGGVAQAVVSAAAAQTATGQQPKAAVHVNAQMTVNQARNAVRSAAGHAQDRPAAAAAPPLQPAPAGAFLAYPAPAPGPSSRGGVALGCASASLTPPNVSAASLEGDAQRQPVGPGNGSPNNGNLGLSCRLEKDAKREKKGLLKLLSSNKKRGRCSPPPSPTLDPEGPGEGPLGGPEAGRPEPDAAGAAAPPPIAPPPRLACSSLSSHHHDAHPIVCERYRVVVSYPPQSEAELELKEGDVVFVHRKREDGWFKGTLQRNGRTGLFPGSFVDSV
ncbi:LOW QUALITY PROTEIN: E3 ubiquitin-protein ligase SH3RF1 [Gadus morhua]|uniref:LOW QUALITY PROTEIN: E3 ubiquitin-protein ligase SH3RF1 n=1 Tax=Gadus morhua TaxID=8049 RepID=UPI0011B697D6|nr:LOW QUALITY PROTEIN: E3 ubiquitin-protein ligase SH3RF1 [Gadus morhua]